MRKLLVNALQNNFSENFYRFTEKHHCSNSLTLTYWLVFQGSLNFLGSQHHFRFWRKNKKIENIDVDVGYLSRRSFNRNRTSMSFVPQILLQLLYIYVCLCSCYFIYISSYLFIFSCKLIKAHM